MMKVITHNDVGNDVGNDDANDDVKIMMLTIRVAEVGALAVTTKYP